MKKEAKISTPRVFLLHASGGKSAIKFFFFFQGIETKSFSSKKYQVHISKVWVALHSLRNAENIEHTPVHLIIFIRSLKINGIILKTSCSRGSKTEQVSGRLLRSMAFFLIALFLWNMESLNCYILLTLLKTQTEFNHFVRSNQFNSISVILFFCTFNSRRTKNTGFETQL